MTTIAFLSLADTSMHERRLRPSLFTSVCYRKLWSFFPDRSCQSVRSLSRSISPRFLQSELDPAARRARSSISHLNARSLARGDVPIFKGLRSLPPSLRLSASAAAPPPTYPFSVWLSFYQFLSRRRHTLSSGSCVAFSREIQNPDSCV